MTTLYEELAGDPEQLGYAALIAAGSHHRLADALNQPRYAAVGPVSITDTLIWAAQHAVLPRLETAATGANEQIAGIARVALLLLSNPNVPSVDLSRPAVQQMLATLAEAGVLTADETNELLALGAVKHSRAQVLFGRDVSVNEVSAALAAGE